MAHAEHVRDEYSSGGLYEDVGVQLRRQYRMEGSIAHFPNREFYDMPLESGRDVEALSDHPPIEGYNLGGTVQREGAPTRTPRKAVLLSDSCRSFLITKI